MLYVLFQPMRVSVALVLWILLQIVVFLWQPQCVSVTTTYSVFLWQLQCVSVATTVWFCGIYSVSCGNCSVSCGNYSVFLWQLQCASVATTVCVCGNYSVSLWKKLQCYSVATTVSFYGNCSVFLWQATRDLLCTSRTPPASSGPGTLWSPRWKSFLNLWTQAQCRGNSYT